MGIRWHFDWGFMMIYGNLIVEFDGGFMMFYGNLIGTDVEFDGI